MTTKNDGGDADVPWDGFMAGVLGAVTVALWFLVLDIAAGRPLYTPTVLGEALFAGPQAAVGVEHAAQGTVIAYAGVHVAAFVAFGLLVAWIVARFRDRGFVGPLLGAVVVVFEGAFYVLLLLAAPAVAEEVGMWPILVANLLAVGVMATYFVLRFPGLGGGAGEPGA